MIDLSKFWVQDGDDCTCLSTEADPIRHEPDCAARAMALYALPENTRPTDTVFAHQLKSMAFDGVAETYSVPSASKERTHD